MKFGLAAAWTAGALLASAAPASAIDAQMLRPGDLRPISPHAALRQLREDAVLDGSAALDAARSRKSVAVFPYSFVSPRDGSTYAGTVVGSDPSSTSGATSVPVVLIPLRVEFTGASGNASFDPTSSDVGCLGPDTALARTTASPIFQPVNGYLVNGVNIGNVTYVDAFQRAQFWSDAIGGPLVSAKPGYHLNLDVTVAPKQTISVSTDSGGRYGALYTVSGSCSSNTVGQDNPPYIGVANINSVDRQLKSIIRSLGIRSNEFPLFIVYGVVMSVGSASNLNNCCVLGYHNGSGNPASPGQTYGIAEYDQGYVFGAAIQDAAVLAHEVLEWVNDPSAANPVPAWGHIGQVGGCQSNLEVGDPLSGTLMPAVMMPNGVMYHMQELAYFSWFMGPVFTGAGGTFSSNSTFGGDAKACPPGGTN